MRHDRWVRDFVRNDAAVSEEFTSLPALSVVIIGFGLFAVLLSQTYLSYEERMEQIQDYQIVNSLAHQLTSRERPFIREGGVFDVSALQQDSTPLFGIRDQWLRSGWRFLLRIHWGNTTQDFLGPEDTTVSHQVAVTHPIGVYLNDAQTTSGTLTIILWRGEA
jgi:hypothetical protein